MRIMSSIGLLLLLLVSCIRAPLCEQELKNENIEILPQWESSVVHPPGVYVESYPQEGNVMRNFLPPSGGWVYLPKGAYDILLYSNASSQIAFRGIDALNTAEAYTEAGVQPDELYSGKAMEVMVGSSSIRQQIGVPMKDLIHTYPFVYRGVTGLKYVNELRVSISGISQAVRLFDGSLPPDVHTLNCTYTLSEDGFVGSFTCFGHGGEAEKHLFVVRFYYGGQWREYTYDVTESLNMKGKIDIYEPITFEPLDGGGMDTDVGDWDDDAVDVPIK